MNEQKGFLDRQPGFIQFMIFGLLIFACSAICVQISFVLIKPLFGIDGADLLITKATNHPEELKGSMNEINALKFIQLFSSLGMFLFPGLIFGLTKNVGGDFLKLKTKTSAKMILLAMAIIFLSAPIVNEIYLLNKQLDPKAFGQIGKLLTDSEKQNEMLTTVFLYMPGVTDFLINIFIIALIPAIAEELFFRGVLQQFFKTTFKNAHVAVWLTAIVFSLFHADFNGFIPRVFLGALLGYLFVWGNSLWVNIGAHFINNASQVVMVYLFQSGISSFDAQSDENSPWYVTLIFTIVMIALLIIFYRKRFVEIIPEPDHTFNAFTTSDNNG
ncbi:MAG: CPBP family intramembrane glutamic endopeptidase [Bacteroidota bacterium]